MTQRSAVEAKGKDFEVGQPHETQAAHKVGYKLCVLVKQGRRAKVERENWHAENNSGPPRANCASD